MSTGSGGRRETRMPVAFAGGNAQPVPGRYLLIANDPPDGLKVRGGKIALPDRPGAGAAPP